MKEKSVEEQVLGGELVTGNFEVQSQLPNGKAIRMSGYIYAHNSRESIDRQVDLFVNVIERQRVISGIPILKGELDQMYLQMDQWRQNLDTLTAKQDIGKLSSQDKLQVQNGKSSLDRLVKDIEKKKSEIAEAEAKVKAA